MTYEEADRRFYISGADLRWKHRTFVHDRTNSQVADKIAGSVNGDGYRQLGVTLRGKQHIFLAHRIVFLLTHHRWPNNQIDHKDGNRLNNEPSNLSDVTPTLNHRNCMISKRNTSGQPGVRWVETKSRWRAYIGVGGKQIKLGTFTNKTEAIQTRKDAEMKYWGNEQVLRSV